jgi:hypothetical protein
MWRGGWRLVCVQAGQGFATATAMCLCQVATGVLTGATLLPLLPCLWLDSPRPAPCPCSTDLRHRCCCCCRLCFLSPSAHCCACLQSHEYLLMVIDTIGKTEVDALAKSLLSYLSHYNNEQKVRRTAADGAACVPWPCVWVHALRCAVRQAARAALQGGQTKRHLPTSSLPGCCGVHACRSLLACPLSPATV